MRGTPQIKLPNEKFVTVYVYTTNARTQNLNHKLLRDNERCKVAKKKFARIPAGNYKLKFLFLFATSSQFLKL